MKKRTLIFWLSVLAIFGSTASCIQEEAQQCECCNLIAVERPELGIKVYTAVTPSAQKFKDSPDQDPETARENPDMQWNDDKNSYLRIDGIESYANEIKIFKYNPEYARGYDTIPVWEARDYGNSGNTFQGFAQGDKAHKTFASGRYYYELSVTVSEDFTDTIKGNFCIIRDDKFENQGLDYLDEDDPLLN